MALTLSNEECGEIEPPSNIEPEQNATCIAAVQTCCKEQVKSV